MSGLIVPHRGFVPKVASSAFSAPNATLVGDVEIGENASIWFGVILRGDGPGIHVGENSNLQDGTVVHVAARGLMTVVGRNVTVGHMALLHACEVQDGAFIDMHSTVLDGAVVESEAMVAAGAVVTPGKVVRRGELWAGNPAGKLRDLTKKDFATFKRFSAGLWDMGMRGGRQQRHRRPAWLQDGALGALSTLGRLRATSRKTNRCHPERSSGDSLLSMTGGTR